MTTLKLFLEEIHGGFNVWMGLSGPGAAGTVVRAFRSHEEQVVVGVDVKNLPVFVRIFDADDVDPLFAEVKTEWKRTGRLTAKRLDDIFQKCVALSGECLGRGLTKSTIGHDAKDLVFAGAD